MNINQREEFRYIYAGLALQGILSEGVNYSEKSVVAASVRWADLLIAELEKKPGEPKFKVGDTIVSKHDAKIRYLVKDCVLNELVGLYDYVCEYTGDELEYKGRTMFMSVSKVDENFEKEGGVK